VFECVCLCVCVSVCVSVRMQVKIWQSVILRAYVCIYVGL
jgi:hypothetical protein